jgi:hypothetical protein
MKICTGCRAERFCSKECQKKTWPAHKITCKTLSNLRAEALKKDLNGFTNPQTSGRCLVRITGYDGQDADKLEGKTAMVLACTDGGKSSVQLTAVQDGVDTLAPGLCATVPQKNLEPFVQDFRLGVPRQSCASHDIMIAHMTHHLLLPASTFRGPWLTNLKSGQKLHRHSECGFRFPRSRVRAC